MRKNYKTSPVKQQGIALWHVLLLVIIAVTVALCAKRGSVPFFQKEAPVVGKLNMPNMPSIPGFSNKGSGQQQSAPQTQTTYYQPQDIQSIQVNRESPVYENKVESLMVTKASNRTVQQVAPPPKNTSYEAQYPRDLASGYYTVQVFSGYNSKNAYDIQKALKRDGYRSYIHQETSNQGILFKVRIGQYTNRSDAFAMKSKIRHSYPKRLGKSFVLLRQ